jgi:hypothetical protein
VDWSSVLTPAYLTTAMIRSMLKVWQVDLQPWSRSFPDYRRAAAQCGQSMVALLIAQNGSANLSVNASPGKLP